jgi:hypothetical protein
VVVVPEEGPAVVVAMAGDPAADLAVITVEVAATAATLEVPAVMGVIPAAAAVMVAAPVATAVMAEALVPVVMAEAAVQEAALVEVPGAAPVVVIATVVMVAVGEMAMAVEAATAMAADRAAVRSRKIRSRSENKPRPTCILRPGCSPRSRFSLGRRPNPWYARVMPTARLGIMMVPKIN